MFCILAGSCLLFRIAKWLMVKYPNGRLFSLSGYSMAIYLFHERSLTIALKIVKKITGGGGLLTQSMLVFAIVAWSICIAKLLEKYQPRVYKVLVGGR